LRTRRISIGTWARCLPRAANFEAALDAAGVRRWPSRANFVLVEIGARHAEFVRLMRDAGVLVRDRSSDPGCDGRVRITIGTREQMRQAMRPRSTKRWLLH
jgi:histidinol-phosphate aminotransferase